MSQLQKFLILHTWKMKFKNMANSKDVLYKVASNAAC
jgi:hypothetical protein